MKSDHGTNGILKREGHLMCDASTKGGIITLLRRYGIDLDGKNVCVIGRGVTVGRTIGLLLTRSDVNATVDYDSCDVA